MPAGRFLEDTLDTGFDNGPVSLRVQPEQAEDYERAAREVASAALRDHPEKLLGACDRSRGSCRDALLDGFAPRAWRRPLAGINTFFILQSLWLIHVNYQPTQMIMSYTRNNGEFYCRLTLRSVLCF